MSLADSDRRLIVEELGREVGGIAVEQETDADDLQALRLQDRGSGETDLLASTERDEGPEAGDLRIDVGTINDLSTRAIKDAIRKGRLIVIDMIGRIEMHSSLFREAVRDAFRGSEDVIAVIEQEYVDEFEDEGRVIELRDDNHDAVRDEIRQLLRSDRDDDT
jgi:nucleoside-triphosphatase THEP1